MTEAFVIEKDCGNFIVKLNKSRILGAQDILSTWDKEEDAIRACVLANHAFELAKRCYNVNEY